MWVSSLLKHGRKGQSRSPLQIKHSLIYNMEIQELALSNQWCDGFVQTPWFPEWDLCHKTETKGNQKAFGFVYPAPMFNLFFKSEMNQLALIVFAVVFKVLIHYVRLFILYWFVKGENSADDVMWKHQKFLLWTVHISVIYESLIFSFVDVLNSFESS